MPLNVWSWWCVETCWKPCHACQVASAMDRFPFHSISSPHHLRAQGVVYTTKWQFAILSEILTKINSHKSLFIRCCCLSSNKTCCFPEWECMELANWKVLFLSGAKTCITFWTTIVLGEKKKYFYCMQKNVSLIFYHNRNQCVAMSNLVWKIHCYSILKYLHIEPLQQDRNYTVASRCCGCPGVCS